MDISLMAADGHPVYLLGLKHLIAAQSNMKLLACCSSAEKLVDALSGQQPDLLMLNINLPDRDGLELVRSLKSQTSFNSKVILVVESLDDEQTIEALRLDIQGVILKKMPIRLLIQCIHKVAQGGQWLEKDSLGHAFEKMILREAGARRLATILTPREVEVMSLVAQGMSNREIAAKLLLAEGTIKIHIHNIYGKLDINNRVDLTLYAQKRGVV